MVVGGALVCSEIVSRVPYCLAFHDLVFSRQWLLRESPLTYRGLFIAASNTTHDDISASKEGRLLRQAGGLHKEDMGDTV